MKRSGGAEGWPTVEAASAMMLVAAGVPCVVAQGTASGFSATTGIAVLIALGSYRASLTLANWPRARTVLATAVLVQVALHLVMAVSLCWTGSGAAQVAWHLTIALGTAALVQIGDRTALAAAARWIIGGSRYDLPSSPPLTSMQVVRVRSNRPRRTEVCALLDARAPPMVARVILPIA